MGLLWKLNELIYIKHIRQCMPEDKYNINVRKTYNSILVMNTSVPKQFGFQTNAFEKKIISIYNLHI